MSEDADVKELSGLEYVKWLKENDTNNDVPSIRRLLGMEFLEIEEGRVVMDLVTKPDFGNPQGTVHGGIASTLLDTVMGRSLMTTLPAGINFTTLELKVNFVRASTSDGQRMIGEGKVIHVGRRVATVSGEVRDEEGRLLAHSTCTCLILGR